MHENNEENPFDLSVLKGIVDSWDKDKLLELKPLHLRERDNTQYGVQEGNIAFSDYGYPLADFIYQYILKANHSTEKAKSLFSSSLVQWNQIGLDIKHFYVNAEILNTNRRVPVTYPIIFCNDIVYMRFPLEPHELSLTVNEWYYKVPVAHSDLRESSRDIFVSAVKIIEEAVAHYRKHEYKEYFSLLSDSSNIGISLLNKNLKEIVKNTTPNYFANAFAYLYQNSEFGFESIDWNIVGNHLAKRTVESEYHPVNIPKEHIDENNYVTIYRGEHFKSNDLKQAKSWSLDEKVGEQFATRFKFNGKGKLYKAQIHLNDILLYIGGNEAEVLVGDSSTLMNIELYKTY